MRFHLIDRIDEYEPRRSVRGRKVVSGDEAALEDHGDGPVLAPPLVLEAICQAGTWLIMLTTERRKRAALLRSATCASSATCVPATSWSSRASSSR